MEKYQEIERSIIKKYRKYIWARFVKAIKDYQLINEHDKIMVCISGGKDSMLMAKCLELLQRYSDFPFELEYVVMNPGYNEENTNLIIQNAKTLNIPIHMFNSDIFEVVEKVDKGKPCYLCARMRRGWLYSKAEELNCNKIALGHHMDDVVETMMMNLLYNGEFNTMMPKLHSDNYQGIDLIRPLYLIREDTIKSWAQSNELEFIRCACKLTKDVSMDDGNNNSKRGVVKQIIKNLAEQEGDDIVKNLFNAPSNININKILGYKSTDNSKNYNFLDDFIDAKPKK